MERQEHLLLETPTIFLRYSYHTKSMSIVYVKYGNVAPVYILAPPLVNFDSAFLDMDVAKKGLKAHGPRVPRALRCPR